MSLSTLREMLTYCRPAGSRMDATFRAQFIEPLPHAYEDLAGNIHVTIDDAPILWSCHTDTVHHFSDRQHVVLTDDWLTLPSRSRSRCLGADDTAGCWLLRELIRASVPGHYVFHYGEECGGQGSGWLARNADEWLRTFTYAIALDRGGTRDVITHQSFGRTASTTFARALATALGPDWTPCEGVYTDTAEYADLIPECTNLSVGYYAQHSPAERLNVAHLYELLSKLYTLDVLSLPVDRVPGEDDDDYGWNYSNSEYARLRWEAVLGVDDCETCSWLEARGFTGYCAECGMRVPRVVSAVTDDDDDHKDVYLSSDYARVQRALRGSNDDDYEDIYGVRQPLG